MSKVTKKWYDVVSSASSMNCATENVVYLISCTRCGVQYVGETSQKLRSRFNNHRNRLKNMANLIILVRMDTLWMIYVLCQLRKLLTLEMKSVQPLRGLKEKIIGAGNYVRSIRMD